MRPLWGCFISGPILKLFNQSFLVFILIWMNVSVSIPSPSSVFSFCLEHCRNPTNLVDADTGVSTDFLTKDIRSVPFSIH